MGTARSARRIQPGGEVGPVGSADPLAGPPPGRDRPPPGALPPRRCAATGSGSARKGRAQRWLAAPAASFTERPRPDFAASPGAAGSVSAPSLPSRGGTGPPAPRSDVDRSGPSSVRPDRAGRPGRGQALDKGARGPRRRRPPTRPVLKHGPRSLTRARVGGCERAPEAQRR